MTKQEMKEVFNKAFEVFNKAFDLLYKMQKEYFRYLEALEENNKYDANVAKTRFEIFLNHLKEIK